MSSLNNKRLKQLQEMYPSFLDRTSTSNFTKHLQILNNQLTDLFKSCYKLTFNNSLERPITIQKVQTSPYNAELNITVKLEHIKTVEIYKNEELVFSSENETENINIFNYTLDLASREIIPSDKVIVVVNTFDEYKFIKGYPENDSIKGDCFDHDLVLDKLGELFDIKRLNFISVSEENYYKTLPPFHAKKTEDDFYYMKRIKEYMSRFGKEYFPVLELWKSYQIDSELINRKVLIARQNHDFMEGTGEPVIYYSSNLLSDLNEDITAIGNYECPDVINILKGKTYHLEVDILETTAPVCLRVVYYNEHGSAIKIDESDYVSTSNRELKLYLISTAPVNAFKSKVYLKSEGTYKFKGLNYFYEEILEDKVESKYMRTKHNYNSCVYDIYASYDDIPANISKPTDSDIENIFQHCMPITKKAFFNLSVESSSSLSDCNVLSGFSYSVNDFNFLGSRDSILCMYCSNIGFTDDGLLVKYIDNEDDSNNHYCSFYIDENENLCMLRYDDGFTGFIESNMAITEDGNLIMQKID